MREALGSPDFIAASPLMREVFEVATRVAQSDVPVLLIGESGAGKGVVARFVHDRGAFSDGPFVKVNCASLPRDLLESELFGHERGAFTGAVARKPGRFEQAAGGTILLDEIGELALDLQAKLLHVLDDNAFMRVGGTEQIPLNARVIAATNKALEQAVAHDEFRDDLYFRLAVVWIEVPPLRKRPEDVVALARHFFEYCTAKYQAEGVEPDGDLLQRMLDYDWPGNVRELKNFVQRCVLFPDLARGSGSLRGRRLHVFDGGQDVEDESDLSLLDIGAAAAEDAERKAALATLEETGWNRKAAARQLNVSYKTLLNKLQKWAIDKRGVADGEDSGGNDEPPRHLI